MGVIRGVTGARPVWAMLLALTLIGCGGSSSSSGSGATNQSPNADAGSDRTGTGGATITLDASASADPDGTIARYAWTQTEGTDVNLAGTDAATASFTAPQVTAATRYSFELAVTDDAGASDTDSVTVTVNPPPDPQISGLDARPSNTTCLAGQAPQENTDIELERVFANVAFTNPVQMLQPPGDSSRWYVVEQPGTIRVFDNHNGVTSTSMFADLRERVDTSSNARESGLLSMAFHPDFADNGQVFLYYQVSEDTTPPIEDDCCVSQLVRFDTSNNGNSLDADSGEVLLSFTAPYSAKNHFGGRLGFDDEGYLYLSLGDGGSAGDPDERAQNTANIWGSMIRIDVDGGSPYAIPPTNPFADEADFLCNSDAQMQDKQAAGGNCPELYAWGLRNPWRWSFDRATGELWLGDVGQGEWEEVNRIQLGGNYGWDHREGAHCYEPANDCRTAGLIDPVAEVPQPQFQSITGGFVYRGGEVPSLAGQYLFADYITGPVYSLVDDGDGGQAIEHLIDDTGENIAAFAEDADGELYVLAFSGRIYRIVAGSSSGGSNAPEQWLSDTGCVDPAAPHQPAAGLVPYALHAPFWSDGAEKQRWMALPDGEAITLGEHDDWAFPRGSVLVKNFQLDGKLIETRLFKHHTGGNWAGYTYAWNDAGTDAELVEGGRVDAISGQDWIYPSGSECLQCHTQAAGRSLGLETAQLNRDLTYPSTGRTANQVATLSSIGMLAGEPAAVSLAEPLDTAALLAERARAYLHTNCAQCHRPGGVPNIDMDLRYTTDFGAMNICNRAPQNGDADIADARRLAPGDADASVLVARMDLRDHARQMPPVGSNQVDAKGVALISEWINAMTGCE